MCGRYDVTDDESDIARHYSVTEIAEGMYRLPNFNAAPMQQLPVIVNTQEGERSLRSMGWGLRKVWSKPGMPAPINARADGIATKPMFRDSIKTKRCIVPATGYYEWKGEKGNKQPFRIHLTDEDRFAMAGLWDAFKEGEEWVVTYTIVTTTPAQSISHIHDRMPVILHPDDYDRWLDRELTDPDGVLDLLTPHDGAIDAYKVSNRVGSVKNNDAELIEPID